MRLVKRLPPPTSPSDGLASLPSRKQPENVPLDPEQVKACLWHARGNVHQAARLLRTSTARLGVYLRNNPEMAEERARAAELMLDKAETVLDGLLDDADRAEDTAKWLLANAGKGRGYGREAPAPMGFSFGGGASGAGTIAIKWNIE